MFGLFQVENFFFVSLAIIFILVILLVYLFKQRINSIETNETSMFGLLQKVVNEVKDLKRRVFCSGTGEDICNDGTEGDNAIKCKEEDDDDDVLDSNNIQQFDTKDDHIQYEIIEVNLTPTSALVKESTLTELDGEEDDYDDADGDAEDNDADAEDIDMDMDAEDMDMDADAEDNEMDLDEIDEEEDNDLCDVDADVPISTENNISMVLDDLIDVSVIGDEEEEDIVLDVEDFKASVTGIDPIHDTPPLVKDEEVAPTTSSLKKMHIHELRRMAIAKGCLPDVVNKMKKSEIVRLL